MSVDATLLELPSGRLSLEFEPAKLAGVLAALTSAASDDRDRKTLLWERGATHDILSWGPLAFVLMQDFGESCILSRDAAGDAVLRQLCRTSVRSRAGARARKVRAA